MAFRRGAGLPVFVFLVLLGSSYFAASSLGYVDRLQRRFFPQVTPRSRLSAGDFPAGVSAPVGEVASVPLRPTRIGFTPRGSSSALLLARGLLKSAYALESEAVVFGKEEELRKALAFGGERGGVDLAAISVDRLAQWAGSLRDAAPRTVLLLGRSRGQEALAAVNTPDLAGLKGKRLGVYSQSSSLYFALWTLSRAGMGQGDVRWVDLGSNLEAGAALREGRADAVVGLTADVEAAARDRGGRVLATTADAPHLIATVLVARGDFLARYPDAVRRVLRGLLDAASAVQKDSAEAARMLGEVAPYLGDPLEAIRIAPPATLKENLSFFGLSGEAPVTYDELFASSAQLSVKVGKVSAAPSAEESRDLAALRYVALPRAP
jgi:ABC-type nitrate/sulfonate/bicarbonate transport system substrate-binding protein